MKNINEYLVNHMGSYEGKPMVNEFIGMLLAGTLIAFALRENIKDFMAMRTERKKARWAHQEKMYELATNRKKDEKDGKGGAGEAVAKVGFGAGLLALLGKAIDRTKDPVEKAKNAAQAKLLEASAVDENGEERTPEDQKKWIQDNMSKDDYEEMMTAASDNFEKMDMDEFVKQMVGESKDMSDEEIAKAKEKAKKTYLELGKQMEADTAVRKQLAADIKEKEDVKATKQEELDKAIAEATATGDEEAIKAAKLAKAEFNKKMDIEIYEAKTKAVDFATNCQSGAALNVLLPNRKSRNEKAKKTLDEAHKKAMEAANKEITDTGGDPKNTDPKTEKQAKVDADVKAAAEKLKSAQDKLEAAKKEVDELEKKAVEEKDPEKQAELKKQLDGKQKTLNDAISEVEKASDDKEWADIAKEYADCNAESEKLHEQIGKIGPDEYMKKFQENYKKFEEVHNKAKEHTKKIEAKAASKSEPEPAKKEEPTKKEEPAKKEEPKEETFKQVDKDGEPTGATITKSIDKDGNEKYTMKDKDGEEIEVNKEDAEKEIEASKKAADDLGDDVENDDKDKEGGDVDTDADDKDGEDVDDGKGGKKKVMKNPAQVWKRKAKKSGGTTKSYYNKKGDSISQNEFREKMKKYQAKKANMKPESVSFTQFMSNHYLTESGKQYTSLRDSILKNIHD